MLTFSALQHQLLGTFHTKNIKITEKYIILLLVNVKKIEPL
jgi:hypothetical protein